MKPVEQPRWGTFDGLPALAAHGLQDGRFSVSIEGGHFEAWLQRQPGERLWVLLSAARDPRNNPLPKFDRWSWAWRFPGSVLCVSDPTLYLDPERLRIGWYLGTAAADWQGRLADLVRCVAQLLGLPTRRVVAYGSSAGGFASLMLAARLGDATTVAINPQSEVLNYSALAVEPLLKLAFGGRKKSALNAAVQLRLSAIARFEHAPDVRCLYVQNRLDRTHFSHHFKPFAEALGVPLEGGADESGRLVALLYDDDQGHAPEPPSMVDDIVSRALVLADAGLAVRFDPDRPFRPDRSLPAEAPDPARLGLSVSAKASRRALATDGEPGLLGPDWRTLDTSLATHDVPALLRWLPAVAAWTGEDDAGPAAGSGWHGGWPAQRALRLAGLLSLQRAGPALWPAAAWPTWEAIFDRHLRHLLGRLDDEDDPATPPELHALAALQAQLSGAARRFVERRWTAAVDAVLKLRFTADGVLRAHAPALQRQAVRGWARCMASGWFDGTQLTTLFPAMQGASLALRWPDGQPLPLGDTGASAAPSPTAPGSDEPATLGTWSGQLVFRDAGAGRVLHLMAGNRKGRALHDDALSVLWSDGSVLLTDPGRHASAPRDMLGHLRSSAAHNTVSIHGRPVKTHAVSSRLLAAEQVDGLVHTSARKTDRRWQAAHVRHVWHRPGHWLLLLDVLTARRALNWTRWLHFGPELEPAGPDRWQLPDGRSLTVHTASIDALQQTTVHGALEPEVQGWLSTPDGMAPAWATGHAVLAQRTSIVTLLTLDDDGATLTLPEARRLHVQLRAAGAQETFGVTWDLEASRIDRDDGT